jgi:hypothetical protein
VANERFKRCATNGRSTIYARKRAQGNGRTGLARKESNPKWVKGLSEQILQVEPAVTLYQR